MNLKIDNSWTFFIDRDGVINVRLIDDYVKTTDEFKLIDGVKESINLIKSCGIRIIIITNQQGIGKKLMTEVDLENIHNLMKKDFNGFNEKTDRIYFCPHLASQGCNCRKPATGMIDKALNDFPDIDINKSILIGDTETDIKLANNAGIISVLINSSNLYNADYCFNSLFEAVTFFIN